MVLECHEHLAGHAGGAKLSDGVTDAAVLQLDHMGQSVCIQFTDAAGDIVVKHEAKKLLLVVVMVPEDRIPARVHPASISLPSASSSMP